MRGASFARPTPRRVSLSIESDITRTVCGDGTHLGIRVRSLAAPEVRCCRREREGASAVRCARPDNPDLRRPPDQEGCGVFDEAARDLGADATIAHRAGLGLYVATSCKTLSSMETMLIGLTG